MNAHKHIAAAETLLSAASRRRGTDTPVYQDGLPMTWEENRSMVERARVHAVLAVAAACTERPVSVDVLAPVVD